MAPGKRSVRRLTETLPFQSCFLCYYLLSGSIFFYPVFTRKFFEAMIQSVPLHVVTPLPHKEIAPLVVFLHLAANFECQAKDNQDGNWRAIASKLKMQSGACDCDFVYLQVSFYYMQLSHYKLHSKRESLGIPGFVSLTTWKTCPKQDFHSSSVYRCSRTLHRCKSWMH